MHAALVRGRCLNGYTRLRRGGRVLLLFLPLLLLFAFCLCFFCFCFFAGIRVLLAHFTRRPCAGRHLLFFAAAKKSRQKKAAHTASPCSHPRAPNVPTLHTAAPLFVRVASAPNQRLTHSNTRTSASGSEWYVPPRWQTVCRLSRRMARRSYKVGCVRYRSGVVRVWRESRHTVCHLGGGGLSGTAC